MSSTYQVVPFGNLRINGYLHLPEAYRSLSRPSSPPRAKASAMRPCLLSFTHDTIVIEYHSMWLIYTFSLSIFSLSINLLFYFVQHVKDRFDFIKSDKSLRFIVMQEVESFYALNLYTSFDSI